MAYPTYWTQDFPHYWLIIDPGSMILSSEADDVDPERIAKGIRGPFKTEQEAQDKLNEHAARLSRWAKVVRLSGHQSSGWSAFCALDPAIVALAENSKKPEETTNLLKDRIRQAMDRWPAEVPLADVRIVGEHTSCKAEAPGNLSAAQNAALKAAGYVWDWGWWRMVS